VSKSGTAGTSAASCEPRQAGQPHQARQARRERQLQATKDEIRAAAWAHLAQHGAPALSLRAIASSIGLSAPALYRYFPSRDHLVTALIVEAYLSLADTLDRLMAEHPAESWADSLRRLSQGYRAWAMARPAAFYLIFGDPIPGYQAPAEAVMAPAARTLTALIATLDRARLAGDLRLPLQPAPSAGLAAGLQAWSDAIHKTHPDILYLAFVIASRVQGLMLVELGRQLPPFLADATGIYQREVERMIREIASPH
jgi:AcrR family transcriptional regulator